MAIDKYTVAVGAKKSRADDKESKMPIDCASKGKLNQLPNETVQVDDNYNIINFEILKSFDLGVFPDCGEKIKLNNNLGKRISFSYELKLS